MIAYNNQWLDHLLIRRDIEDAFDEQLITKSERDIIDAKYPVGFYTPNIFIRIGLFILTIIIMLFSYGLLLLMFMESSETMFGALAIFLGVFAYLLLEYMIRKKKHYRSGVDDALLWGAACAIFAGLSLPHQLGNITNCIIIFMVTVYGSIRFTDRLMAITAFISMLGILFFTCTELGNTAKAVVPFIIMAASMLVYVAVKNISLKKALLHYSGCLSMIKIITLTGFYIAGNYYVVRELSNSMFNLNLQPGETIPFGWLFWIFTIITPLVYIARGIQKKDVILIRVGLLLVAAIIFTIRYYHSILPVETMMSLAGIILLIVGYTLMKYLHEPKHGFTYREISSRQALDKLNIESLVIAETFAPGTEPRGTEFGGGSFGGGGASGEY